LSTAVGMALIALPPPPLHAHDNPSLFDVFSIRATTGGYYLRTVSPKGDRINATCQPIRKGTWDFAVEVYPAASATVKYQASPALTCPERGYTHSGPRATIISFGLPPTLRRLRYSYNG
jgi:hypothetical protein